MENKTQAIFDEITKAIVGKNDIVKKVLTAIFAGGHCLLDDVPGVGKTTLALSFSKALGLDYKRIQFTSDTVPSDITGFSAFDRKTEAFSYREGAAMTNLLLADEINRTSSKTQSALLEVMEEKSCTVDGVTYRVPEPFIVLATQNPIGSAGTQLLPESQLDRFMICLSMGYPDFKSQVDILKGHHSSNPLDSIKTVCSKDELCQIQQACKEIFVADEIYEYITTLAEKTRENSMCVLGLSPRGALAVCSMAKATAYMQGRDYCIPEDVQYCFADVATHRLVLGAKARMAEKSARDIAEENLSHLTAPIIKATVI